MVDFNGNLVRERRRELSPGKIQLLITYKSLALKGNKPLAQEWEQRKRVRYGKSDPGPRRQAEP